MKSTQYSEKVLDHFRNPRNMGEIENADGFGRVGNPVCGDLMFMYIKVAKNDKDEEYIEDIKFKTFGCGSAVATSSMITEMAKGLPLEEAYKITRQDVAEELEGLPPIKMHCSNLAADALRAAIDNYRTGSEPEVEVATACQLEIQLVMGFDDFLGKGTYKEIPKDLDKFRDKRILIVDTGDDSLELALKLTDYTGRVVLVTSSKEVPGRELIAKRLKKSDVKILQQSELLEVKGELNEVDRAIIHDFDENENYELYVDIIIYLDYRG